MLLLQHGGGLLLQCFRLCRHGAVQVVKYCRHCEFPQCKMHPHGCMHALASPRLVGVIVSRHLSSSRKNLLLEPSRSLRLKRCSHRVGARTAEAEATQGKLAAGIG